MLKTILSISGKPGLYKLISQGKMGDEEKRRLADFVIVNDGETPLIPQVLGLITFLSQNNTYLCPPKK